MIKWLKKLLRIARILSPEVDLVSTQAEELHQKTEAAKQVAGEVSELVDEIRDLTKKGSQDG